MRSTATQPSQSTQTPAAMAVRTPSEWVPTIVMTAKRPRPIASEMSSRASKGRSGSDSPYDQHLVIVSVPFGEPRLVSRFANGLTLAEMGSRSGRLQ